MFPTPTSTTESEYHKPDPPLSHLLDAIESRLDSIAGTESETDAITLKQVDGLITRISEICRKAKNIKNSLAPINKFPPETLALIVAFLGPGRQLIDATAVCQHWRTTLLSSPRLWNKINCSNVTMFEAYLERSRSVPLEVHFSMSECRLNSVGLRTPWLTSPAPHVPRLTSLALHTARVVSLVVRVGSSSDLDEIARYLPNPIPTLHEFGVAALFGLDILEIPSGINNDHFPQVKKLRLTDMSSFRAPRAFPRVTELVWVVGSHDLIPLAGLLDTMEQLPVLERVEIVFKGYGQEYASGRASRMVTLPHVQQMSLRCPTGGIPSILGFLKLPNLTSLVVDGAQELTSPTLPATSLDEHLPKFVQLSVMEVSMYQEGGAVSFRGPSETSLDYHIKRRFASRPYRRARTFWGGLPLHSVQKLVVELSWWVSVAERAWVVGLLRDLESLEHLELRGCCGHLMRYLRRMVMRGSFLPSIKTLTVHSEYAYDSRQALRLKDVVDGHDLGIIVACITDSELSDHRDWDTDGSSEDWDYIKD